MRVFTLDELSSCNGRDGAPTYIAYKGIVYDVSSSYFFRGGRHWVRHSAGKELFEELAQAPHDASLLERFPIVGRLSTEG